MLYQRFQNLFLKKILPFNPSGGKKTDLRRWNVLENLISKWENPSLVELHRLARTEMERLNHAKNANSQRISICEKRLSLEKNIKLLFKKQRYIFSHESQKRMVMRFPTVTKR